MAAPGFKKYSIAGESNPNWVLAEPLLLSIWADGILKASLRKLHLIHLMGVIFTLVTFIGGFLLRLAIVSLVLFLGYLVFPGTILISLEAMFSDLDLGSSQAIAGQYRWPYELLGYAILITSVSFALGSNLKNAICDACLYIGLILTNMVPLRIVARGLKNGNYFAQLAAKSSFGGMLLSQTIAAAPRDILREWDRIFDLYTNSNSPAARAELERLAAKPR